VARYRMNLDRMKWSDISADTDPDTGMRVYHTPSGPALSVTTILGSLPNPELDAWRERVGPEEAARVSKEATTIGTYMHDILEAHLKGEEFPYDGSELESIGKQMSNVVRRVGWRDLTEVWAIEIPLHFGKLYAGRSDLVGTYKRKPAIMDYKTSRYIKPVEQLEKYRLQLAAYGLAAEHMFGEKFEIGVNFFAIRPNNQFSKPARSHVTTIDEKQMQMYKIKWAEILVDFYREDRDMDDDLGLLVDLVES